MSVLWCSWRVSLSWMGSMGTTSFLLRSMFSNQSSRPWLISWKSCWSDVEQESRNSTVCAQFQLYKTTVHWLAPTWHCMRASCSEDLHSSSELPSLSQWLFMSFSLACSSRDSSESVCMNSALHRLMDSTMALRLSYAFCSSCGQRFTFYS